MNLKIIKNNITNFINEIFKYVKQHKVMCVIICLFLCFTFFWIICGIDIAFKFLTICITFLSVILGCTSLIIQSIVNQRNKIQEIQSIEQSFHKDCLDTLKNIQNDQLFKYDNEKILNEILKHEHHITELLNEIDTFTCFSTNIMKRVNSLLKNKD